MIYCPNCGTANRDGSRFCNDCGADLSAGSGRRCPMCSAMNPPENTVCNKCGARLVPKTGPLTEAERSRPDSSTGAPQRPAERPLFPFETPLAREEAGLPDWLQQLRASAAWEAPTDEGPTAPEKGPAEPAEEIPEWLREIRPLEEVGSGRPPMTWDETEMRRETPSVTVAPYPSGEEEPDWLKRLRMASARRFAPAKAPVKPTRPQEFPPTGEVPAPPREEELELDWLRELRPAPEMPPVEAEAPPLEEAEELPEWLRELRPAPEMPSVEAEAPSLEEAEELPEWLRELRPTPEMPPVEAEAPPLEEAEELPEWLRELRPTPEMPPVEAEAPPLVMEARPEAEIPEWLKELGPTLEFEREAPVFREAEEIPPPVREEASPAVLGVEVPAGEVLDWLEGVGPEEAPLPPPTPVTEVSPAAAGEVLEVEGLARAEIPAWLQDLRLRGVKEGAAEMPGVIEAIETTGLLAGISGVLPVEPIIGGPHKAPPAPPTVTVGLKQADLFREIIAQEPAPVLEVAAPGRARLWKELLRRFIYLLIALAVIIPLFGGGNWFKEAAFSETGKDFYDAIQNLPPDSVVLLAFDYDPFTAAEMDRLAGPILWHLMDRQARLMAVSLLPTGPVVAENLLDRMAEEHGRYQYGQNYVNLGYIPGQAAAPNELASNLRALLPQDYRQQKLDELPVMQDVNGIQDVDLLIEFAAQYSTLQWWIEQAGSLYQIKVMAAVSAAVEPMARPYYHSGQLEGLISGLPGAAQYETKTSKWPSLAIASVDAQSMAHLAMVALIILGALSSLVSPRRK